MNTEAITEVRKRNGEMRIYPRLARIYILEVRSKDLDPGSPFEVCRAAETILEVKQVAVI